MKTIRISSLFAVLLCAGCSPPHDEKAEIAAINQKMDWLAQSQSMIISNQMALSLRMDRQFAALPRLQHMDTLSEFYQTNSLARLTQIGSNVVASEQMSAAGFDYVIYGVSNAIANTADLQNSVDSMQRDLSEIRSRLAR